MTRTDDLKPTSFPELSWDPSDLRRPLEELVQYVVSDGERAANWYFEKRGSNQRAGRSLRVFAIVFTAIGGVTPVLAQILQTNGKPGFDPTWSTIALALAGLCLLLDKFYGFTSAWIRYIVTGQKLKGALEAFRLNVETARLGWGNPQPDASQAATMLTMCGSFLQSVHASVREETAQWAQEFRSVLKDLEGAAKEVEKAKEVGAINVKVANGDQCQGGWNLVVDGGAAVKGSGKITAVNRVTPGIHTVKVTGQVTNQTRSAEKAVAVPAGSIVSIELTLE